MTRACGGQWSMSGPPLTAHESQTAHMTDLEGFIRGWAERAGSVAGFDEGRLAEGFFVVSIPV